MNETSFEVVLETYHLRFRICSGEGLHKSAWQSTSILRYVLPGSVITIRLFADPFELRAFVEPLQSVGAEIESWLKRQ